ncbi:uncharacterized protein TNCV_4432941 [Trichonephila clavipes]|nr:uncharacterized protein TNCV_4432941 [Trichonephila clavipes]
MFHPLASVDQALESTTSTLEPGTSRLEDELVEESSHDFFSFIALMVKTRYTIFQSNIFSPHVQQLIYRLRWGYYASGGILMCDSGTLNYGRRDREGFEHNCIIAYLSIIVEQLHSNEASVFSTVNGIFLQDNTPCHKGRIAFERFNEHNDDSN